MTRFRAAWATETAVGCAVAPKLEQGIGELLLTEVHPGVTVGQPRCRAASGDPEVAETIENGAWADRRYDVKASIFAAHAGHVGDQPAFLSQFQKTVPIAFSLTQLSELIPTLQPARARCWDDDDGLSGEGRSAVGLGVRQADLPGAEGGDPQSNDLDGFVSVAPRQQAGLSRGVVNDRGTSCDCGSCHDR